MSASSTAFLFTGQGSQFAGMGRDLAERFPAARAVFEEADDVLGAIGTPPVALSRMCFEGPDEALALTVNTQPATLAVAIACWRALGDAIRPQAAAGHSLGEYGALVAASVFTFADALRLVRERARRMQAAVPVGTGGMVVLRKLDEPAAREIAKQVTRGVCDVANINAPGQIVLSGQSEAMDEVLELVGPRGGLRLPVSVPFHSSMLAPAAAEFARVLDDVAMAEPTFPIYCNVDAARVETAAAARDALRRQFAGSVLWQKSIERMLDDGFRRFVEFGPKPTLVRMVTQIANAHGTEGVEAIAVTTAAELDALLS